MAALSSDTKTAHDVASKPCDGVSLWRGFGVLFVMLGLLIVALLFVMIAARAGILPGGPNLLRLDPGVPHYVLRTGQPELDTELLRRAVRGMAVMTALNGFVLLLCFAFALHRIAGIQTNDLLGPARTFWRDGGFSLLIVGCMTAGVAGWIVARGGPAPFHWFSAAPMAACLLALALPFQALAEEVVFRGFLQSWLTRLTGSFLWATPIQATLFAALHPGSFAESFAIAWLLTLLTIQTGNLGAAWIVHLFNNAFVLAFGFLPLIPDRANFALAPEALLPLDAPVFIFLGIALWLALTLKGRAPASRDASAA